MECFSSEMVIFEVGTKPNCVSQHPSFGQVCLQKWSLQLAAGKCKTRNKTKYCQTDDFCMLSKFLQTALFYFCCLPHRQNQFAFVFF